MLFFFFNYFYTGTDIDHVVHQTMTANYREVLAGLTGNIEDTGRGISVTNRVVRMIPDIQSRAAEGDLQFLTVFT